MSFLPMTVLAHYDETDRFKLMASVNTLYDDNVFRLDDNQNSGSASRSDTITTPQAQAIYNNTFSRQNVLLDASVYSAHYRQNSYLDYTGYSFSGKWLGNVGERWHPQLGYENNQTLTSFEDVYTEQKDLTKQSTLSWGLAYGGASYAKVLLDGSRRVSEHDSQTWLNVVDQGFGMAGVWTTNAGSQATLRYDQRDIDYTEPLFFIETRDYTQQKWQVMGAWPVTHKTHLNANIGRIVWDFDANNSHSSDFIAGLGASWAYTEKLQFSGRFQRDADAPGANIRVSISNNYSLQANWEMMTKLAWDLLWSRRDTQYGVAKNSPLPQQDETSNTYKLGLTWVPYDFLTSAVFVQKQMRDSNVVNNDYQDNQYGINLQVRY